MGTPVPATTDTCDATSNCTCPVTGGPGTKSGFFLRSSFTASITTAQFVANYAANVASTKTALVAGALSSKIYCTTDLTTTPTTQTPCTAADTMITSPYPTAAGRRAGAIVQYYFIINSQIPLNLAALAYTPALFTAELNKIATLCPGGTCAASANAYAATSVKDTNPTNPQPTPTPPTTTPVSPAAQTTTVAISSAIALVFASIYFSK